MRTQILSGPAGGRVTPPFPPRTARNLTRLSHRLPAQGSRQERPYSPLFHSLCSLREGPTFLEERDGFQWHLWTQKFQFQPDLRTRPSAVCLHHPVSVPAQRFAGVSFCRWEKTVGTNSSCTHGPGKSRLAVKATRTPHCGLGKMPEPGVLGGFSFSSF